MKRSIFLFVLLVVASMTSAHAGYDGFRCTEQPGKSIDARGIQYAVKLTTLQEITDKRILRNQDEAYYVKVEVFARDARKTGARFARIRAPFLAIAKSADVIYGIDARRENGFQMGIYLDEMDQSWATIAGVGELRLTCNSAYR